MEARTVAILRRERMDTALSVLIDLFAATKEIEGKSPRTIRWYLGMLESFANFLGEGSSANDLTLDNGRAFVASLRARSVRYVDHPRKHPEEGGLAPSTIHAYVRCLKAFGSWLADEGLVSSNPFTRLKRPKLPLPVIEILSDDEIERIMQGINPSTILGSRLYIIVLLLLDTGIRASELCSLTLDNTHIEEGYIKVCGKGSKERHVPIGSSLRKALIRYVNAWRPEPTDERVEELILSINGYPLTYDGLAQAIKRLGKRVGIPRLHAHLFRHTFAVRYLMNGGDVMTLKLILGHTTLEVTQVYMHLAESHVQLQHNRFSPVDRLGITRKVKAR
jgi:site-specific recombinase XerD